MEWISVKDRLPPDGVEVLTYPAWGSGPSRIALDQWSEVWKCFLMFIDDGGGPTHWMPLPLPPLSDRL